MCDRIRSGDERNEILNARNDRCIEINKDLDKCLSENDRDFRKCKKYVNDLRVCMEEKLKKQLVVEENKNIEEK